MVRYVSAKRVSIQEFMKEVTPDFNSKLSAILKAASNPTWDLKEITSKKPEETNVVYLYSAKENQEHAIFSMVKIHYKGTTDTKKDFYIDITKAMCVNGLDLRTITKLKEDGIIELVKKDKSGSHYKFANVDGVEDAESWEEEYYDSIRDWDDWIDNPNFKATVDLDYPTDNVVESYDVEVDKIDNVIQKFVDTYIDK